MSAAAVGRPLVVAVGNRFRRDDGVGPAVLDELARRAGAALGAVEWRELDGEPTRLIDAWADRWVVVVDAVVGGGPPGEVVVVRDLAELAERPTVLSSHSGGVADAVALAAVLDRHPRHLCVVGVVALDTGDGPGLSTPVAAAVGAAADAVERELALAARTGQEATDVPG